MPLDEIDTFEKVETNLLKLYKVTANRFKESFDSATKRNDESYKLFACRLGGLLHQYLKSKDCDSFDKLVDLICTDKLLEGLPANAREFLRLKSLDSNLALDEVAHLSDCYYESSETRETYKSYSKFKGQSGIRTIQTVEAQVVSRSLTQIWLVEPRGVVILRVVQKPIRRFLMAQMGSRGAGSLGKIRTLLGRVRRVQMEWKKDSALYAD